MDFVQNEHKILEFWQKNRIFEKLRQKNKGKKPWSFLDGPITANNPLGVHHAWGRTLKDLFQRYWAMKGYDQRFQNGFDCQGLWVEVEVEKELGFKNKKDIERYGIEKFVAKCEERVHKYSMLQTNQLIRLGQWCDWGDWNTDLTDPNWLDKSHSYYTMSDENNYAIWHFLKKCFDQGLLYKGHDVVPWCPRCGTAISQHEILTEEYKELTHQAVFVRFKTIDPRVKPEDDKTTYFLVWTTTPWTLPANVFLSVHPDLIYAKVKDSKGDIYILLKDKADLIKNGQILETFVGKKLVGLKYQGIFDELLAVKESLKNYQHQVYLWKDVTQEEGTGIVHSAPGCGQEDFALGEESGLPVINPTDDESRYCEGFGELTGKFVGAATVREWVFNDLSQKGLVYKIKDYTHRYPTCWRCKSELIFRLVDEWYISMTSLLKSKIKNPACASSYLRCRSELRASAGRQKSKITNDLRKELIMSAKKIKWIPDFCLERELDWLKNMHDWLISKKRYWGLALPIFECECGHFEVIGSREELQKRAVEGWRDFNGHSPHRPWIDGVKIKCEKCGKLVSRIPDVGSPWLDAGIVPFSTMSRDNRSQNIPYFHNQKAEWRPWFPAELVCESFPGQFKNWFYVLLVMSQVLEKKPPFKTLLGYASVVDEKGEEMHKSKGNAIWLDEAVEKIGADVMRWMYVGQNPALNMRFGYNIAKEAQRKLLILWNCYTFFNTYVKESRIKNQELSKTKSENILDKWIISRLNGLVKNATTILDKFDMARAGTAIEDFFIGDLSLWYIRRSRKRLAVDAEIKDKVACERTLYNVLLTLTKLIAPIMPFLAEEMYQGLKSDKMPESVHLCDWSKVDAKLINRALEKQMNWAREVVSLALAKRAELGIAVRMPLARLKLKTQSEKGKATVQSEKLLDLIKDEVNVKKVVFDQKIKTEVELDTAMTPELKLEGQQRELVRQIQDLRKKASLQVSDQAVVEYDLTDKTKEAIFSFDLEIYHLLTTKLQILGGIKNQNPLAEKTIEIDGQKITLRIFKS